MNRPYLLGQLTGDALEQFEQRLFSDNELFEELLAAEDELIDESLAGELNRDERELFAKVFLVTPERERNLQFRRALKRHVSKNMEPVPTNVEPVPPTPWRFAWPESWAFRAAAAMAAMVLIAAIAWNLRPSAPPTFATVNLSISSSTRGAGAPATEITLPVNADDLRLHLALPEPSIPAKGYRVELIKPDGEETLKTVAQDDKSVDVVISPASQLKPGRYALNVYAIKPDGTEQRLSGSYYLTVK